jgi:putative ABC transport system ATP-binding protein
VGELGIRIEHLRKRYGEGDTAVDALKDVNMTVAPGEVVGLIGPSGSGKSTLLKCLGAVIEPSGGRMVLGGEAIYEDGWKIPDLRALRRDSIGFVFQAPYLIPFLDVTDNVALLPMLAGRPNAEARTRARELLKALDVDHRAGAQPSELSGGEQQRVSIARALANRPPVILADEPTAPLDSERALAVVRILNQMAVQYHTASHRGHARREDHPDLQADLSHPRRPDRRRGGARLEPLTRSSPVAAAVNQEQECEHIQGGLAGEVTGRGRSALRVANGPVRRSHTVRWRSGAPGGRGHSALRALVQLRRRVRLRDLRSGALAAAALGGTAGRLHRRRNRPGLRRLRRPCMDWWCLRDANRRRDDAAHVTVGGYCSNRPPRAKATHLTERQAPGGDRR